MLKAILFDFDGVLVDTEPLHFQAFQKVLASEGIPLSETDYYAKYVGFDDKGCFQAVFTENGRTVTPETIRGLVDRKAALFLEQLKTNLVVYPGITDFVTMTAQRYRLAVVSGALRHEIEYSLEVAGIRRQFEQITAAQDVRNGKPDPEGYLHALRHLNRHAPLTAPECLVIEDTVPGIRAAHEAGMRCLAVANTFTPHELSLADAVTSTLENYDLVSLVQRFWN
ncbi:MAG TPA: HAD family phosphatase [Nitrospirales bacterium]|jgi:HAD superfamily hydrolase (TIGR01509 family)